MQRPIVYYISAHGYGHGVRAADILNALARLAPAVPRIVVSALPAEFLASRMEEPPAQIRPLAFDVGMVQLDSIRVDLAASLEAARGLLGRWDELVGQERLFHDEVDAAVVVADIPAIPVEAARRGGRPALAVGNFAWDWIYHPLAEEHHRDWGPIAERFAAAYEMTDLLLRLPFAEPMSAFPKRVDVPLLSESGRVRRDDIQRLTGADPSKRWVLLSFTTLNWESDALERVARTPGVEFFSVGPLAWPGTRIHSIDRRVISFGDVLASVDGVVSKPGFGIVSECIANQKPLLHSARRHFREYPILVGAIEKYLRQRLISEDRLYSGDLAEDLRQLWAAPGPSDHMKSGGAEIAARRILDLAHHDP